MSAGTVPAEETAAVSPWTVLAWVSAVSGPLAYAVGGTFAGSYGRAAWLALLTALALAVGGFAVHDASRAADAAAQGRAVQRSYLGLPFTAIRATPVRLTGVDGPPELPRQRCLLLLGSSAGVAVLLDGTTVWRVPTDAAMTGSGCR